MLMAETYLDLMTDPAHLMFEMTLTVVQDVVIGAILWPIIKRATGRFHRELDLEHGVTHPVDPGCRCSFLFQRWG